MKAHFVGIGGIGMSALARYFVSQGVEVTGSDEGDSPLIDELREEGVLISVKHNADIVSADLYQIVYSEAIPPENPERQRAQELGIPQKSYFAALGDISKTKTTLSICGTHGKSTTAAMAGLALENAFLDPLVILGTKVFEWGSRNIRLPQAEEPVCAPKWSGLFLVESCEYHNSFLYLQPKIIVVTNMEPDHLDFFGTEEKYYHAFRSFAEKLDESGTLIADFSKPKICNTFSSCKAGRIDTSDFLNQVPEMAIPGKHNRENAACVLAIASALQIPVEPVKSALQKFNGTWRRFEKKGEIRGIQVFDDYAHHPTEVRATLASFREKFPDQKIWAVFQPHQYSRTREFLDEFAKSFANANEVSIPNIYRVRDTELDVASVSPEILVEEIAKHNPNVRHTENFLNTVSLLQNEAQAGDIIVTIGAGPVYKVGEEILRKFE